jgi:hypothetical protein
MAQGRTIAVFSNTNGTREIIENSEFTTWGELKAHLQSKGLYESNMQAVVKGLRVTLTLDAAQLPETEFTLFLVPGKMKSGGRKPKEDAISVLTNKEFKKLIKALGYKGKATDRSSLTKWARAKGYGADSNVIADLIGSKKTKTKKCETAKTVEEKAKEVATENIVEDTVESTDGITADEAKSQVSDKLNTLKEDILEILSKVKTETIKEGFDLFKGLDEEFDEIAGEIAKN